MNTPYQIGLKYIGDKAILRLKEVRYNKKFIMDNHGEIIKLNKQEFTYLQSIRPIGLMTFFEVKIDGGKDVICTLHRMIDLDKGITTPYIASRVSIVNFFAAPLENDIEKIPIGMCMSNMTCPSNIDFSIMLQHNGIIKQHVVCVYIDDTVGDILRLINTISYDNIIQRIQKHFDPNNIRNIGNNLSTFLDNNGWMDEFNNAFNIVNLRMKHCNIEGNEGRFYLSQIQHKIEREIGYTISINNILRYNAFMDLTQVLNNCNDYMLIRFNNYDEDIYILDYTKHERLLVIKGNQRLQAQQLLSRLGNN